MARAVRGLLQGWGHGAVAWATHDGSTSGLHGVEHARRPVREGRGSRAGRAGRREHGRGARRTDNLQGPLPQDVRPGQGADRLSGHSPLGADDRLRYEPAARTEERRRINHELLIPLDPNLTLTRPQHPTVSGKRGNKKPLIYEEFARPCNAEQSLT